MPDYDVTSPDGKTYRVTAPDGATKEQVLAYAKAHYAAPEKAPKQYRVMTKGGPAGYADDAVGADFARTIGSFPYRAAAAIPGLLAEGGNALRYGINKITGSDIAGQTSEFGADTHAINQALGIYEPQTATGQATDAALALLTMAPAAVEARLSPAALAVKRAVDAFKPVAAPIDNQPGLASQFGEAGAKQRAGYILNAAVTGDKNAAVEALQNAPAQTEMGAAPTMGEVAGDTGLAALQRGVANSGAPGIAGKLADRKTDNTGARLSYIKKLSDDIGVPIEAVQEYIGDRLKQFKAAASDIVNSGKADVDAGLETVGPGQSAQKAGGAIRSEFKSALAEKKAQVSRLYNDPVLTEDNPLIQLRPTPEADLRADFVPPVKGADLRAQAADMTGANVKQPQTLLQWVRKRGGIAANDMNAGDVKSMGLNAKGMPTLVHKDGVPLDTLVEGATEQGYLKPGSDINDLLLAIDNEYRSGQPSYRAADLGDVMKYREAQTAAQQADQIGFEPARMTDAELADWFGELKPVSQTDLQHIPSEGRMAGPIHMDLMDAKNKYFGKGAGNPTPETQRIFAELYQPDHLEAQTLLNIQSRANNYASQLRASGNAKEAAFLGKISDAVDNVLESPQGLTKAQQDAIAAARVARKEQGALFEQGPNARVGAVKKFGEQPVTDAEVPALYFNKSRGAADDADAFIRTLGSRRAAVQAAKDYLTGDIRNVALKPDGTVDAARWNTWLKAHSDALKPFPELRDQFSSIGKTQALVDHLDARGAEALERFKRTPAGKIYASDSPASVIKTMITQQGQQGRWHALAQQTKNLPEARAGIRAQLLRYIADQGSSDQVTPDMRPKISENKMLTAVSDILRQTDKTDILTPQQRAALGKIRQELQRSQAVERAAKPTGSDTASNLSVKNEIAGKALTALVDTKTFGLAKWAVKVFGNQKRVEALIGEAILDPKFAAELLKGATPKTKAAVAYRFPELKLVIPAAANSNSPLQVTIGGSPRPLAAQGNGDNRPSPPDGSGQ